MPFLCTLNWTHSPTRSVGCIPNSSRAKNLVGIVGILGKPTFVFVFAKIFASSITHAKNTNTWTIYSSELNQKIQPNGMSKWTSKMCAILKKNIHPKSEMSDINQWLLVGQREHKIGKNINVVCIFPSICLFDTQIW